MDIEDRLREWGAAARRASIGSPDVPVARMQRARRRHLRLVAPLAAAAAAAAVVALVVAVRPHNDPLSAPAVSSSPQSTYQTAPATPSRVPCGTERKAALSVYDADGSLRWNTALPAGGFDQSPLVADGPVVYAAAGGAVSAYRVADGRKIWERRLGSSVYYLWLVDDELVADVDQVSTAAKIIALDPASGAPRWTYPVPGRGFLGNAALTSDGALAFTVPGIKSVVVLDLSSGTPRWSTSEGNPNPNTVPSAGDGLVLILGGNHTLSARDSRTGVLRWRAPNVDTTGEVVISGNTGVIVPGAISGPTTVVAHSLTDGAVLWRYTFAYFPEVFPDSSGYLLADQWKQNWTLVDAHTGRAAWNVRLRRSDALDQQPTLTDHASVFVVLELNSIAFVDHASGHVRRVQVPTGQSSATAAGSDAYILAGTQIRRVSPDRVVWTATLPQYPTQAPTPLADGAVAVQTQDPICAYGGGTLSIPAPTK